MPSSQERSQCPGCHAALAADSLFCEGCGARFDETPAQELRSVSYLLSELKDWEAQELIASEAAAALRGRYESRREALRAQIDFNREQTKDDAKPLVSSEASAVHRDTREATTRTTTEAETSGQIPAASDTRIARDSFIHTFLSRLEARAAKSHSRAAATRAERRPLFETLADPYILRLLLYTGAAMLVVGVVIWLRDVLYLKLREPLVQASLLAIGTIAVTISGWLLTLRTKIKLTGRALTLIGSLLVPVNFWFLVRSGLISNNGRAWMVCALCAALYAQTAALLRERLYVYLACVASIATGWALVYRATPEAHGLYSLTTMTAALIFVHLARVFPVATQEETRAKETTDEAGAVKAEERRAEPSRWSYELWGPPLVRVALAGAGLSAMFYMMLRLGSSPSFDKGFFRWRTSEYDAGLAMLLFAAGAYVAWFTARYIYVNRRALLYTTGALALFWTEFLLLDGLQLSGQTHLITLATTALVVAFVARLMSERVLAESLHRASATVLTVLFMFSSSVALILHLESSGAETSWRLSVFFVLAAAIVFGALRSWRGGERSIYGGGLAAMAAMVLVAAALDALRAASLFPSSWPIAAGVVCAAFLLQRAFANHVSTKEAAAATEERAVLSNGGARDRVIRVVMDCAVVVCAVLWLARTVVLAFEVGWSAACVLLLTTLYWMERAARWRSALLVYVASAHAGVFVLALLMALRVEGRWVAFVFTLTLFPLLFALSRMALARGAEWLARPLREAAAGLAALISFELMREAAPVMQAGNELLLAPAATAGALCVVAVVASLFSTARERVHYFRLCLGAAVVCFVLMVLRAGYDPLIDVEMYTSPIAVLLLIISYVSVRGEWDEYARDTSLLLWTGSMLLCVPLLVRALQFRLLMDVAAPWRDLGVLGVSLALVLFGVMGRLRAPVVLGTITLIVELVAVALTSVEWLQVPLKVYLITAGVLIIVVWGVFEYRREQLLLMRERLHERGAAARESFSEWR